MRSACLSALRLILILICCYVFLGLEIPLLHSRYGVQNIAVIVSCMSASISQKKNSQTSPNFLRFCLWLGLGRPLISLWHVMYLRFVTDVISAQNGRWLGIVDTRIGQHGLDRPVIWQILKVTHSPADCLFIMPSPPVLCPPEALFKSFCLLKDT